MKTKLLGIAVLAIMASAAFTASSASATTLEVGGVTQNSSVELKWSLLEPSIVWARTDGAVGNSCAQSTMGGKTTVVTGAKVTVPLQELTFLQCSALPWVIHKGGQLYIEHEAGTTSGDVFLEDSQWTVPTSFGTINCKTGEGTKLGTLNATSSGHATMAVNAVLNCGFLAPSITLKATFQLTSPTGLGVSA
ncbi:MAG TPA: hypothetical protein VGK41_01920 [Solirubrobacterales bacterium]